jgi:hypothetical protein
MKVSLIVTGGFIQHQDQTRASLENERLMALHTCLMNLGMMDTSRGDEIVFAEYGLKSRLKNLCELRLKNVNYKYVFVEGKGFNQSRIKNAGAEAASNEIVCWINSDVLVRRNLFDIIRSRFEQNPRIFVTCARHDIFTIDDMVTFFQDINQSFNYTTAQTQLDDTGWCYALNKPKQTIPTDILAYIRPGQKIIHDFLGGYINFGELMCVTKEIWRKYPFDDEVNILVDTFMRDNLFGNEPGFEVSFIHNETAIFHLSGSDYMGQEKAGSDKFDRLIKDIIRAARKYPWSRHWMVFGYFKEFDPVIAELNVPFKEIYDKWRTPLSWKYFRDKQHVKQLYGVTDE